MYTSLDKSKKGTTVIRQKRLLAGLNFCFASAMSGLFISLWFSAHLGQWQDLDTSVRVARKILARPFPNSRRRTQANTNNKWQQHCGPQLDVERWGLECHANVHRYRYGVFPGMWIHHDSSQSAPPQPWKSQRLQQWDVQPDNLISGCSQTRSALNSSTTSLCLIISHPSVSVRHKPSYLGFIAIQLMSR